MRGLVSFAERSGSAPESEITAIAHAADIEEAQRRGRPALDPFTMHGAGDGFGGTDEGSHYDRPPTDGDYDEDVARAEDDATDLCSEHPGFRERRPHSFVGGVCQWCDTPEATA